MQVKGPFPSDRGGPFCCHFYRDRARAARSSASVARHVQNLFAKPRVNSRTAAAAVGHEHGPLQSTTTPRSLWLVLVMRHRTLTLHSALMNSAIWEDGKVRTDSRWDYTLMHSIGITPRWYRLARS